MQLARGVLFSIFIFSLLSVSLLSSVSAQDTPADTVTISVEAWMVEKYNMPELEARFEADHPDVDVVVITHEGLGAAYLQIFLEWAQTDASTADLYFGGLVSQLAPAVIDDQLLPWDDVMTGDLAPEMWIPAFLDSAYVAGEEGSNYPTLPGLGETMNFQYNTNHFVAAGLVDDAGNPVVPTTYDEL